jgi:ribosomal protein S18 acetylase RimI-like enzyme
MYIRAVRPAELPILQDIERAAGDCFRDIGMGQVADDEPLPLDVLASYHEAGRAWVAVEENEVLAGYLVADVVDGNQHIEQVSVHPRFARQGVGRQLIEHLAAIAVAENLPALTLTTFTEVPWNAPYYQRCGFAILCEDDLTPGLRIIRQHEAGHGLDRWPRVGMRRELSGPGNAG